MNIGLRGIVTQINVTEEDCCPLCCGRRGFQVPLFGELGEILHYDWVACYRCQGTGKLILYSGGY